MGDNLTYTPETGTRIDRACQGALALAAEHDKPVDFLFNDTPATAYPGELPETVQERWGAERERLAEERRNSPEAMRRIMACLAACEGIPTDRLEGLSVGGLLAYAECEEALWRYDLDEIPYECLRDTFARRGWDGSGKERDYLLTLRREALATAADRPQTENAADGR